MAGGITKEEMEKLLKRYGTQSSPDKIDTDFFNKNLKAAGEQAIEFGKGMTNVASTALDSFQNLSKSGAGFSNDLISMTKAAFNSRLNLAEFSDVIKTNAANLAGLGGNVTRGAEAFQRLSKEFFDSGASDTLRDLGYTSKDLNEILAIQVGSQKSSYKDTEEGRRRSIQAASDLAKEMDAVAKLTGKSREEQMDEMKRRKVDGQVEAKFRLIAQEKGEDVARKVRAAYEEQRIAAAKRGDEELFKQQFATNTYLTKSAGTNAAILGDQARALEEAAAALGSGDIETARQKQAEADAAALKNANDRTILTLSTFGAAAGPAGEASQKFVENTDTMYHSVKKVAEANGLLLNTQQDYAKALKMALDDIKAAQSGLRRDIGADGKPTGPYKDVSGVTRGVVTAQQGMQDAKSAAATAAAAATSESLNKLGTLADQYRQSKPILQMEQSALKGLEAGEVSDTTPSGKRKSDAQIREEKGGLPGQAAQILKDVTDITVTGVTNLFIDGKKVEGRQEGSAGMTGKILEDFGQGTLMMLHGKEGVVTEDQLTNLAKGMKADGVADAVGTLKSSLPMPGELGKEKSFGELHGESVRNSMKNMGLGQYVKEPQGGSVNLSEISKTISTSVSSMTGGSTTTKRTQSDESQNAEKELDELRTKFFEDWAKRKEVLIEGMAVEDRKYSKVQAMMKADETAMKIKEEYEKKKEELHKKIEDGIKYEVETKKEQLEEVKKVAEEQLKLVKLSSSELIEAEVSAKEEHSEIKQKEREEILKKADELRSIVGTNIKGMSDDAIAALLPAGTTMEDFYQDMDGNLRSFAVDSADSLQQAMENEKEYQMAKAEFDSIGELIPKNITSPLMDESATVDVPEFTDNTFANFENTFKSATQAIDLNALNLPGFGPTIKSAQATVAPAVTAPKDDGSSDRAEAARLRRQGQQPAQAEQPPAKPEKKEATLSDLLSALNTLNTKMGQLISQNAELGSKQVKAVNKMSQNGFVS